MCGSTEVVRQTDTDDNLLIRYLLGAASAEEQAEVEEQYFRDAAFHALLLSVEQELICDYVRGQLAPPLRARFESHYLATAPRRRKYEQVKDWLMHLRENSPSNPGPHR